MHYDLSKTLNENIKEQSMGGFLSPTEVSNSISVDQSDSEEKDALIAWRETYPNKCKYPDRVIQHPKSGNLSQEESLIHGFCFYPRPSSEQRGRISGVWVPAASEIRFYDVPLLSRTIDFYIKKKNNPNDASHEFWKGFTDEQITEIVSEVLPIDSIMDFNVGNRKVVGYLTKTTGLYIVGDVKFKGLYYSDTKEPYISPSVQDTRDTWEYLVDEYGTKAQIATAVAFIALSVFTGGLGGMALLATEIAVEGTLGAIIAKREWDKGNKVGAGIELLFGLTPFLKTTTWARGVSKIQVDEIVKKIGDAGLTATSSPTEIISFYRGLSETQQQIFSKMLKDTSDELTEASLKKAMGKQLTEEVYSYVRKNPELLKDVSWYQKVWAKEGLVNGTLLLFDMGYNIAFGKNLTEQEKMEIKGIITTIPNEFLPHFTKEILSNPETNKLLVEKASKVKERMTKNLDYLEINKAKFKDEVYKELQEVAVQDSLYHVGIKIPTMIVDTNTTAPKGYVTLNSDDLVENASYITDIVMVNGVAYYLLKK
jgi:hypothetical protein